MIWPGVVYRMSSYCRNIDRRCVRTCAEGWGVCSLTRGKKRQRDRDREPNRIWGVFGLPVSVQTTRLRAVHPRTCLPISGSDKRHDASSEHPNWLESQIASYSLGTGSIFPVVEKPLGEADYRRTAVSTGNTFQGLPRYRETANNTARYITWYSCNIHKYGKV